MKTMAMRSCLVILTSFFLAGVAAFAQGAPQTDYAHMTMKVDKLATTFTPLPA
jgi:hypothetical protein